MFTTLLNVQRLVALLADTAKGRMQRVQTGAPRAHRTGAVALADAVAGHHLAAVLCLTGSGALAELVAHHDQAALVGDAVVVVHTERADPPHLVVLVDVLHAGVAGHRPLPVDVPGEAGGRAVPAAVQQEVFPGGVHRRVAAGNALGVDRLEGGVGGDGRPLLLDGQRGLLPEVQLADGLVQRSPRYLPDLQRPRHHQNAGLQLADAEDGVGGEDLVGDNALTGVLFLVERIGN